MSGISKHLQYSAEKKSPEPIRDLFAAILQAKCPVVTHNGLIDLAFMYQVSVIVIRSGTYHNMTYHCYIIVIVIWCVLRLH